MAGIAGLLTVADANQLDSVLVAPNLCPAVLLRARPLAETALATGLADDAWYLDCTLWVYEPPAQTDLLNDDSLKDFRRLTQQLEAVCRTNLAAGGLTNDSEAATQVLVSGREMQKQDLPALTTSMGQVIRRARRSPLIREIAFYPPFS